MVPWVPRQMDAGSGHVVPVLKGLWYENLTRRFLETHHFISTVTRVNSGAYIRAIVIPIQSDSFESSA
jgi:hypothetical protein